MQPPVMALTQTLKSFQHGLVASEDVTAEDIQVFELLLAERDEAIAIFTEDWATLAMELQPDVFINQSWAICRLMMLKSNVRKVL